MLLPNDRFPDIAALGDWLHSNGLKFGIYSCPGEHTCGGYLGSLDHEQQDAEVWNSWGVDYLKYDWCGYHWVYEAGRDKSEAAFIWPYLKMQLKALIARDIWDMSEYFSVVNEQSEMVKKALEVIMK